MSASHAMRALRGEPGPPPVGIAWLPTDALVALFHGAASGPAQALGALCREVPLDLAFIPAEQPWAEDAIREVTAADALPVLAVAGPLGRVAGDVGWMETLHMTASAPSQVAFALDEALHQALAETRRVLAAGAGALLIADDLAGARGPLVSPDYALEVLVPLYGRLALEAKSAGVPAIFHSDGDIRVQLPALARAGFAGLHPGGLVDEALAATHRVARGADLVVLGGLAAVRLLAGSRDSALAALDFAEDRGVIITDDGGISSAEELAAFVTTTRIVAGLANP